MACKAKGLFVTGTDTEVGKTFVSALILKVIRQQGIKATYFKPVATGCEKGAALPEDLEFVSKIAEVDLTRPEHCPVRYEKPLAPLAAARLEGKGISLQVIFESFESLVSSSDFIVVEGVGGLMVPITEDFLVLDLMEKLSLPSIVVARPSLGTINHTLLTIHPIHSRGISLMGFVTNGHKDDKDEAAQTSPALIEEFSGAEFLGHIPRYVPDKISLTDFIEKKAPFLRRMVGQRIISQPSH